MASRKEHSNDQVVVCANFAYKGPQTIVIKRGRGGRGSSSDDDSLDLKEPHSARNRLCSYCLQSFWSAKDNSDLGIINRCNDFRKRGQEVSVRT